MSLIRETIEPSPALEEDLADPLPPPLMERARTDRAAFGELYDRNHGMIYRYCRRRLGDREMAEDVCSAVFVAIAERIRGFQGKTEGDFRRWAFGIARNQTAAAKRKSARRTRLLRSAVEEGRLGGVEAADPRAASDDAEGLAEALATLSERAQTLLDLRYTEGLTHEEIARAMGLRAGAVRTAISRALARLRREFGADSEAAK